MNHAHAALGAAVRRVCQRLVLRRICRWTERGALPTALLLGLIAICLRGSGQTVLPALSGGALVVIAVAVWLRRPDPVATLAAWDAAADRQLLFTSAWCFLRDGATQPMAALHIERALRALPGALPGLAHDLPLTLPRRTLIALILVLGIVVLDPWRPAPAPAAERLDAAAAQRAAEEAAPLAALRLDDLVGLAVDEQQRVDRLQTALGETAQQLSNAQGLPTRELLAELDRLAHEAEALAAGLAGAQAPLAALAEGMDAHADLAALGAALRAGDHQAISQELTRLAQRAETLTNDERRRLTEALDQALSEAGAGAASATGTALAEARQALGEGKGTKAAKALSQAAERHARQGERAATQRRLGHVAEQLRRTGARVAGRPQTSQQVARTAAANRQGKPSTAPLAGAWRPPSAGGAQPAGKPGTSGKPGAGGKPGSGSCAGGGGSCAGGMPPIPGSQGNQRPPPPVPGGSGSGSAAGAGAGRAPVPGASILAGSAAGRGGSKAGRGSTALGRDDRRLAGAAAATTTTDIAPTGEAPGEQRETMSAEHHEAATVDTTASTLTRLAAEEDALDADTLPLARRDQVLRYFTAVRTSLEASQP